MVPQLIGPIRTIRRHRRPLVTGNGKSLSAITSPNAWRHGGQSLPLRSRQIAQKRPNHLIELVDDFL